MTFEEALRGKEIPEEIRDTVTLITVPYFSFAGTIEKGQLVLHADLASEVEEIFSELCERCFPIERMVPVAAYGWDDESSMCANNSSAFNYRVIAGTDRLSNHAYGRAIDINPLLNPYVRGEVVAPAGAQYDPLRPGAITVEIATIFKKRGWEWGGDWTDRKDWQHFEKRK